MVKAARNGNVAGVSQLLPTFESYLWYNERNGVILSAYGISRSVLLAVTLSLAGWLAGWVVQIGSASAQWDARRTSFEGPSLRNMDKEFGLERIMRSVERQQVTLWNTLEAQEQRKRQAALVAARNSPVATPQPSTTQVRPASARFGGAVPYSAATSSVAMATSLPATTVPLSAATPVVVGRSAMTKTGASVASPARASQVPWWHPEHSSHAAKHGSQSSTVAPAPATGVPATRVTGPAAPQVSARNWYVSGRKVKAAESEAAP